MKPALVEFCGVFLRRGERTVAQNLSFTLPGGESLAVLGPNGSGKSTLIKAIYRELYPERGEVRVMGREGWDVTELRRHVGLVSDDLSSFLDPDATVQEAVLTGFFAGSRLWPHQAVSTDMRRAAARAIRTAGLHALEGRRLEKLSTGERRRTLIARALVRAPRLLLLDEPSLNLDPAAHHAMRRTISRLICSGVAVIIVTHDLTDVVPEIQRVLMLKAGRIAFDGKRAAALDGNRLSRVFGTPLSVVRVGRLHVAL